MIIFNDHSIQTRSDRPNTDWTNGKAKYVVEDGSELAQKLLSTPAWTAIEDNDGNLIDITAIELPTPPRTAADVIADIKSAEAAQQRSQAAILAAQIAGDTPAAEDVNYFLQYEAAKSELRAELATINEAESEDGTNG